jgi:hypothetical protein
VYLADMESYAYREIADLMATPIGTVTSRLHRARRQLRELLRAASHEPTYPRTCSSFIHVSAAMPVVAGSGTGAYQGISGSF